MWGAFTKLLLLGWEQPTGVWYLKGNARVVRLFTFRYTIFFIRGLPILLYDLLGNHSRRSGSV